MAPLGHLSAQPACSRQDGRGSLRDQRTPFCFLDFTESRAKLPYELQHVWTFFSESGAFSSHFAAHKTYQTDLIIWGNWRENKKHLGLERDKETLGDNLCSNLGELFHQLPSENLKYTFSCLCRIALLCLQSECGNFPSQTYRGEEINRSNFWLVGIQAVEKLPPF